jgi:hypothetical protein
MPGVRLGGRRRSGITTSRSRLPSRVHEPEGLSPALDPSEIPVTLRSGPWSARRAALRSYNHHPHLRAPQQVFPDGRHPPPFVG